MMTLGELKTELERIIRYESVFRSIDSAELTRYINMAYRELAAWSYALTAIRSYQIGGTSNDYPHQTRQVHNNLSSITVNFQPIGLIAPYHLMWHRGNTRISLRPAVYVRPEVLLENADRERRAPTPIDEFPAPIPSSRFLPQHKLVQEEYDHPHEYIFHNGRCFLRPAPKIIANNPGQLWLYGAFVPMTTGTPTPPFTTLVNDTDLCQLPVPLVQHLPDVAYYYYARAITDLFPLAVQRYNAVRELAQYYRQQLALDAIQGVSFDTTGITTAGQNERRKR